MNFYIKRRFRTVLDFCIGWTIAFVFLSIVRGVGTVEVGQLKFEFIDSMIIAFTLGPAVGLVSGFSQVWAENRIYRKVSLRKFFILRLCYAVIFIIVLVILAYITYQILFGTEIDIITFAFDDGSIAIYFYVLVVDITLSVVRQVNLMMGKGNLKKMLTGRFYNPREEHRVFMFVDLRSSTQIAEKLGHINYSSLLQDCFNDLGVVVENEARVYQYVGDEAVLTWERKAGFANENFIQAFYRFKSQLDLRKSYYMERYGLTPFFKAGVHAGTVTVTEIGKYKKEIAYHGDAINTASRIQGMCNQLNAELLISQSLSSYVKEENYFLESAGSVLLKGKQEKLEIYSVKPLE